MMINNARLSEKIKLDLGVLPISKATAAETGAYFTIDGPALFVFQAAAMAATKTVIGQLLKATDALGTGSDTLTGAAATITANTNVTKALLTAATIADGDSTVTINGVVFTCEDTDPDIDAGEFASGANDDAACVNLAAAINHLLGETLVATAGTGIVTLTVKEKGEATITVVSGHATIVASTLEAMGYIEIEPADLGEFTHAALRLTTDATIVVSAALLRLRGYSPAQKVAAAKVL